jgi:hypothetical protein
VVLTSSSCYSACLDFMDRLLLHPAILHVGEPTGVDTDYMESWFQVLPSGLARLNYPTKVFRNRRRLNNEGYEPVVRFDGTIGDTPAVREWILEHHSRW